MCVLDNAVLLRVQQPRLLFCEVAPQQKHQTGGAGIEVVDDSVGEPLPPDVGMRVGFGRVDRQAVATFQAGKGK